MKTGTVQIEAPVSRGQHPHIVLRAVESVEKCSWECFWEGTKSRPMGVRLAGRIGHESFSTWRRGRAKLPALPP